MSTGSSPAPRTPRKRQTARMSTGKRPPSKTSASQYVDDEADHDSDVSNGNENVDKYESDFIDDTVQEGEPIEWADSPPRMVDDAEDSDDDAASNTEEQPAPVKRVAKKRSAGDTTALATPMVTRSRARTSTTPIDNPGADVVNAAGAVLNTSGYKGARTPGVPGVKSNAVRLGMDPGNTQGSLEIVKKSSSPVKVAMSEAEHAAYLLFKQSRDRSSSLAESSPSYQTPGVKEKHRAPPPAPAKSGSRSARSTPTKPPHTVSASGTVGTVPVPTWNTSATVGSRETADNEEMDDAPSAESEHTVDSTATEGSGSRNGKLPASPSKSAIKATAPSPKRKRSEPIDSSPSVKLAVPVVHFDRSPHGSPSKKRKEEAPELHTVDVKTCSDLPDICEVMDPSIQDAMMKPIYGLNLPHLKKCQVTTWSSSEGPGMFELSYYPVLNPKLSIDTVWALLLFVRKSAYINPARIDPRLLEARSPHYIPKGPKKRWAMSIDKKPAVCVSIVNCVQSSLLQVSTVGQAASPLIPVLKFITGVHLSQDFERIVGLCGMVFQLDLMHVQLHMSALTFGTKGIPIEQYEKLGATAQQPGVKSSGNIYKKNTYVPASDSLNWNDPVPVYDGRFTGFDAAVDIDNLDKILPVYDGDIPANCCTAVGYTISHYVKHNGNTREQEDHISFNLQWAVVLGEPEE